MTGEVFPNAVNMFICFVLLNTIDLSCMYSRSALTTAPSAPHSRCLAYIIVPGIWTSDEGFIYSIYLFIYCSLLISSLEN